MQRGEKGKIKDLRMEVEKGKEKEGKCEGKEREGGNEKV